MESVVTVVFTGNHRCMELKARIGLRIREIRKSRSLSQEALADLIGRSVDSISLLERGKIAPGIDTLEAVSKGLDVPLRDLLDFGDKPSKDNETIALQTTAIDTIRKMSKPMLSVAVKQLDALAGLKGR